jgi:HD-GYP domain-containing protein (c-di-GMP phosphodiesterase class II)
MQEKINSGDSIDADHVRRLTQIGVALSAEKDIDRLLEKILTEARVITLADGGTLYMMSEKEKELQFVFVQNESLGLNMGGTGGKMTWPPIKLTANDGLPNHANVSAHVAITGQPVNIADVYDAPGFNFEGPRAFDQETGYRSRSMLVVPMRNHENDIIGVLQLLNATDPDTGEVISFSGKAQELAWSLASQAAVALTNNLLITELENLLDAFIQTIAIAIDEKSPYTGGHVRRVADLTIAIAEKINEACDGHFAKISFSDDEMRELRMAAWLHDVGKITTPEHVVDKSTKLEKVYDRIGDIKTRFELLKREYQMVMNEARQNRAGSSPEEASRDLQAFDEEYQFLVRINNGCEFTADEMIERIKIIAQRKWSTSTQTLPLLTEDEIYNLSIRRGTLNDEERNIINNHAAITYKMLAKLPFPRKLQKIAEYAAAHHEKLDGSGYPLGLKGDQLPLQSRIIALADVFEALTATDRPYKKDKTLSETLQILKQMVADHHIDADLFELFMREKVYAHYAYREMALHQIDM